MFAVINSSCVEGIGGLMVSVEIDMSSGLPGFDIVGMVGNEIKEARERVRVALKNISVELPPTKITVNLAPANIKKRGTGFDMAIAVGILTALGKIDNKDLDDCAFVGEMGLNGEIQFVSGILPIAIACQKHGIKKLFVPITNLSEGAVVEGIEVFGVNNLCEIIDHFDECKDYSIPSRSVTYEEVYSMYDRSGIPDFADVLGQDNLKRCVKVAAAGMHHMIMVGPPGAGKSMIAKRMPSILPILTKDESMEVSGIYSVAGKLSAENPLIIYRPYMAPHHTVSDNALTGGGTNPKPGVISLSHRGVLFLDELPHFGRTAIEALRQPLEDKEVTISRVAGNYTYPADFMLIGAMNPCPCGYYPDSSKCRCSEAQISKYLSKISGPFVDRIDICATALAVKPHKLKGKKTESSEDMLVSIEKARIVQKERYKDTGYKFNSEVQGKDVEKYCIVDNEGMAYLDKVYDRLRLSARSYHKTLKVARTIADLDGKEIIDKESINEALSYRWNY